MVEKRAGKLEMKRGLVLLLVLLVAVGVFFLFNKSGNPTGYVTNVNNASNNALLYTSDFSTGDYHNTQLSGANVILAPNKLTGEYTSQVFDAGQSVVWTNFVPTYTSTYSGDYNVSTINNSIVFYVKSCDDAACTGKDFSLFNGNLNLLGQYFQYKAVILISSGTESPVLSQVDVSSYPPVSLPLIIESPQSITYNNESVPISISSNNPGATITFFDGTSNQTYVAPINMTFTQGQHVITAWVSYTEGSLTYTNSTSVTFTVEYLQTYYRLASNACSSVSIVPSQKTAADYDTLAVCQAQIVTTNSTTTTEENASGTCVTPVWQCENWSDCVDGTQTRVCYDTANDNCYLPPSEVGKPAESQSCTGGTVTTAETPSTTPATTTATTTTKKGFFGIVGSVIAAPFGNVTRSLISIGVLALLIAGFVVFKASKQKSLGVFFSKVFKRKRKEA